MNIILADTHNFYIKDNEIIASELHSHQRDARCAANDDEYMQSVLHERFDTYSQREDVSSSDLNTVRNLLREIDDLLYVDDDSRSA